ncbi:MAG: putative endo-beta-N-acetylglucosaminidase [Haloplasmataceae bacterium]|nr:putative endo-beta-N-acetylglucosaminidase [Haloplasmataceae bacterium]
MLNDALVFIEENLTMNVTSDFLLPELNDDFNDVTIEWSSSNTAIIGNDGNLIQPNFDTEINITIKLSYKDKSLEKVVKVTAVGKSEQTRVEEAKATLTIPTELISENLTLPISNHTNGASISWATSNSDVISNTGVVTRTKVLETVTLTATLTIGAASATKEFTVTVNKVNIVSETFTPITKLNYIYGEELDLDGGEVTVTYEENIVDHVDLEIGMISNYDKNTLGNQEVAVTYNSKSFKFNVNVLDQIETLILTNPTKLEYIYGEPIDITGGLLKATYKSGKIEDVTILSSMISGYNSNVLGNQTVKVTIDGKENTFNVVILDKLEKTELVAPTKIQYFVGEELDLTNGLIKKTYKSGLIETFNLELVMVSGYDKNITGDQNLTVTYETKPYFYDVEVVDEVTELTPPTKVEYLYGEELDLTGSALKTTNSLGEITNTPITMDMVSGYDRMTSGNQTVTVTYEEQVFTFVVTVADSTAIKLPTPFGIVTTPTGINWGLSEEIRHATGFKVYIEGVVGSPFTTKIFGSFNIIDLNLEPGTYSISLQAYGDGINYADSDLSGTIELTVHEVDQLAAPTGIVTNDTGIVWGAVGNAVSYKVNIEGVVGSPFTSNIASFNLLDIGLIPGNTYIIKIQAIGNGIHFTNSDLSVEYSYTVPESVKISSPNGIVPTQTGFN